MIYEATRIVRDVVIPEEDVAKCLEALNRLRKLQTRQSGQKLDAYASLVEALVGYGLDAHEHRTQGLGTAVFLDVLAHGPWHAERYVPVFRAIAPYVFSGVGAQIVVYDEHDRIWRYLFDEGTVVWQAGSISWHDEPRDAQ